MSDTFSTHVMTRDVIAELEALHPTNPFVTGEYFAARERLGFEVWVAGLRRTGSDLSVACGLFFKQGLLNLELEIVSLPSIPPDGPFWPGLLELCQRRVVTQLTIETYASPAGTRIPVLATSEVRHDRTEFVLDLHDELEAKLSLGHRAAVDRARGAGIRVARSRSLEALRAHLAIVNQPMIERGESIEYPTRLSDKIALLESEAGELVQASLNDRVLASALILHAPTGAFYQSGGTSPSECANDAATFLLHEISLQLRDHGATTLSLGGARPESELAEFRKGFGAIPFLLQTTICDVGPLWKRRTSQAFALARFAPSRFQSLIRRD